MRFIVGTVLAAATLSEGVRVKHLAHRSRAKRAHVQVEPMTIDDIPTSFLEATYPDEDFFAVKSQDTSYLRGSPEPVAEGVTAFHRYEFPQVPNHWHEAAYAEEKRNARTLDDIPRDYKEAGYPDEDFFEPKADNIALLEAQERPPAPTHFVQLFRVEFPTRDSWYEASYTPEAMTPMTIDDVPESFLEAHYPEDNFFADKPQDLDFLHTQSVVYAPEHPVQDSTYHIGIVPQNYLEAIYPDEVANVGFLQAYEIHHPRDHRHTANVLGTHQEGDMFWTKTTQPNMDHYVSTFDARAKEAAREGPLDQAIAKEHPAHDEDETCADCEEAMRAEREAEEAALEAKNDANLNATQ